MAEAAPPREGRAFERLVLFDGVCVFCNRSVRWLMERDPEGRLRFAPLQGPTAAALRARHPEIPQDIDTMVLVEREDGVERVSLRSQAAVRTLELLPDPPAWLAWISWIPRPVMDLGYRLFAALRYRLFGRFEACPLPTPDERARILD